MHIAIVWICLKHVSQGAVCWDPHCGSVCGQSPQRWEVVGALRDSEGLMQLCGTLVCNLDSKLL